MAIKLKVRAFEHGDVYELADIPRELWDQFCKRAEEILPEHKDTGQAWAALFSNLISSVLDSSEQVFLMHGIPADGWQALCEQLASVGERPDTVFAKMIVAAREDRLMGGSMQSDKSKARNRHTLIVTGIPTESVEAMKAACRISVGASVMAMLRAAASNELVLIPPLQAKPKATPKASTKTAAKPKTKV